MGERFRLSGEGTTARYNYGLVMAIFMGCVFAYVIVLTFIGPEALGRDMAESTVVEDVTDRKGEWEDGEKAGVVEDEGRRVPV